MTTYYNRLKLKRPLFWISALLRAAILVCMVFCFCFSPVARADESDVPHLFIDYEEVTNPAPTLYFNFQDVRISFSKDVSDLTSATATFNGVPIDDFDINSRFGYTVDKGEGTYTVTVTNAAGNSINATFIIDVTNPTYAGIENNKSYNADDIDVTYSDALSGMARVTVNGVEQSVGTGYHGTDLAEGKYTFVFTDRAGNSSSAIIFIDKTPPTVNGVIEGGIYSRVDIEAVDVMSGLKTLSLNGVLKDGNRITVDVAGEYTLEATDNAGNVKTVNFVIDKEAPAATITNDKSTEVKEFIPYKGEVWVSWNTTSDPGKYNNTGVTAVYSVNDSPYVEYLNGTHLSQDGEYIVTLTNVAGIERTFYFILDNSVDIEVLEDNGNVLMNGGITFNSAIIKVNEELDLFAITRDGVPIEYKYGETITDSGYYEFHARDKLGNEMSYTFYVVDSLMNHYFVYKRPIGYKFNSLKRNGISAYVNDEMDQIILDADGEFEVQIKNLNDGRTVDYFITIDTQPPVINTTGLISGSATTANNVTITSVSADCVKLVVMRNGKEIDYTIGEVLNINGEYVFTATDKAGNQTKIEFTLKKTINVIYLVFGALLGVVLVIAVGHYADKRRERKVMATLGYATNRTVTQTVPIKNGSASDYKYKKINPNDNATDTVALDPLEEKTQIELMDIENIDRDSDLLNQSTIAEENEGDKKPKKNERSAEKHVKKSAPVEKGKLIKSTKPKKPKKNEYSYLSDNTLDDSMISEAEVKNSRDGDDK